MNKPNKNLLKLCSMSYIKAIDIDYKQTGNDTAETYVTITGINGDIAKGLWETYKDYLFLHVSYNSVASIHDEYIKQVAEWKVYEEDNKKDLVEFERLKLKFG